MCECKKDNCTCEEIKLETIQIAAKIFKDFFSNLTNGMQKIIEEHENAKQK